MDYEDFLRTKSKRADRSGFTPDVLNPMLFPFQSHIVRSALERGRSGMFADCGLGKTIMELEFGNQVADYTGMPVLLTCPLAVGSQTLREAGKFGYAQNVS